MIKTLAKKYKSLLFYLAIATFILLLPIAYDNLPNDKGIKTFYIPSSKPKNIINTLQTHGYTVNFIDKIILESEPLPTSGWYTVTQEKSGRFAFFSNLHMMKTDALMNILVYAGETKKELTHRLANDMKLDQKILLKNYQTLTRFNEADILAKHYTIARNADENATMQYLFNTSNKQLQEFEETYFSTPYDLKKIKDTYIIASIIQKESNSIIEMPLISAVIHNRLDKNMYLQIDATLNYGSYAHTIVSKKRIKNDISLYNTYKHKGLPPQPLSSITIDALEAAAYPEKNDYLFFMLTKTGAHTFSETYKAHLENISIFRQYQEEKRQEKERALNLENNESITKIKSFKFKDFKKFKL